MHASHMHTHVCTLCVTFTVSITIYIAIIHMHERTAYTRERSSRERVSEREMSVQQDRKSGSSNRQILLLNALGAGTEHVQNREHDKTHVV